MKAPAVLLAFSNFKTFKIKQLTRFCGLRLIASDAQSVGDTIDIVEPRSDQCDLQNCRVVKGGGAEFFVISGADFRGVFGELNHVVQHHAFLRSDWSGLIVHAQGLDQVFVESDATQKLCVGLNSIKAAIGDGNNGGDHLVLPTSEREFGRHQCAEGREGVMQGGGNQSVRADNGRGTIMDGKDRGCILDGISGASAFEGAPQFLIGLR